MNLLKIIMIQIIYFQKMALMKLATTWERFILKDLTKFGRYAKVSWIYTVGFN